MENRSGTNTKTIGYSLYGKANGARRCMFRGTVGKYRSIVDILTLGIITELGNLYAGL